VIPQCTVALARGTLGVPEWTLRPLIREYPRD